MVLTWRLFSRLTYSHLKTASLYNNEIEYGKDKAKSQYKTCIDSKGARKRTYCRIMNSKAKVILENKLPIFFWSPFWQLTNHGHSSVRNFLWIYQQPKTFLELPIMERTKNHWFYKNTWAQASTEVIQLHFLYHRVFVEPHISVLVAGNLSKATSQWEPFLWASTFHYDKWKLREMFTSDSSWAMYRDPNRTMTKP